MAQGTSGVQRQVLSWRPRSPYGYLRHLSPCHPPPAGIDVWGIVAAPGRSRRIRWRASIAQPLCTMSPRRTPPRRTASPVVCVGVSPSACCSSHSVPACQPGFQNSSPCAEELPSAVARPSVLSSPSGRQPGTQWSCLGSPCLCPEKCTRSIPACYSPRARPQLWRAALGLQECLQFGPGGVADTLSWVDYAPTISSSFVRVVLAHKGLRSPAVPGAGPGRRRVPQRIRQTSPGMQLGQPVATRGFAPVALRGWAGGACSGCLAPCEAPAWSVSASTPVCWSVWTPWGQLWWLHPWHLEASFGEHRSGPTSLHALPICTGEAAVALQARPHPDLCAGPCPCHVLIYNTTLRARARPACGSPSVGRLVPLSGLPRQVLGIMVGHAPRRRGASRSPILRPVGQLASWPVGLLERSASISERATGRTLRPCGCEWWKRQVHVWS